MKASSGQCHRYQEYETLPMNVSGGSDSILRLIQLAGTAISSTVPKTENNAGGTRNSVCAVSRNIGAIISARPAQLAIAATALDGVLLLRSSSRTANATPAPSSHARAGSR